VPTNDELSSKVINIFERHKRGEQFHFEVEDGGELVISPDGFNYVSFRHEDKNETFLLKDACDHRHYIVKMLEQHKEGPDRLNHYYVPGHRINDFMHTLSNRPGSIVEIKQFIPNITG